MNWIQYSAIAVVLALAGYSLLVVPSIPAFAASFETLSTYHENLHIQASHYIESHDHIDPEPIEINGDIVRHQLHSKVFSDMFSLTDAETSGDSFTFKEPLR